MQEIRFIELFCGVGGFRLGLERANNRKGESLSQRGTQIQIGDGIDSRNERDNELNFSPGDAAAFGRVGLERVLVHPGGDPQTQKTSIHGDSPTTQKGDDTPHFGDRKIFRCVWANDNDRYACQIYRARFGGVGRMAKLSIKEVENSISPAINKSSESTECRNNVNHGIWHESSKLLEGDIRNIRAEEIPDHELLTAGFPCQSFSIAGKRRGFQDRTRGTLFFEICRIARAKRPKYLLLENVKGLLSHDEGRTFAIILLSLDELGYDVEWQVLNTKYWLPQNRERIFIFGVRREGG